MEGFCRGCLIKYDDPMDLLQYTEKNRRLFVYSTGLQVKRNDAFTFQLCKDCFLNMKLACKFKKSCRTSDKKFKSYLALKDVGDPMDFCTFLKNHDNTLTFRLPFASASSTPAHQKRDDDNDSTCTSIRNFMTDLMQGQEVPDTEARIIREVIEEEADIFDDSLDSHWLQDDNMSIDTDFRLNGFSPFSTPRSTNNDHCYTPKKYTDLQDDQIYSYTSPTKKQNNIVSKFKYAFKDEQSPKVVDEQEENNMKFYDKTSIKHVYAPVNDVHINVPVKEVLNSGLTEFNLGGQAINNINDFDLPSVDNIDGVDKNDSTVDLPSLPSLDQTDEIDKSDLPSFETSSDKVNLSGINVQNFYLPQDEIVSTETVECGKEISKDSFNIEEFIKLKQVDNIDRNLEKALKNEENKEYSLVDLLGTPTAPSGASTPTINNILFGEKLEIIDTSIKPKLSQCIEPFEDVQGDIEIFEEFFQNDTKEFNADDIKKFNVDIKIENFEKTISLDKIEIDKNVNSLMDVDIKVPKEEKDQPKSIHEIAALMNEIAAENKAKKSGPIVKIKVKNPDEFEHDKFDLRTPFCKICKKTFKDTKTLCSHFTKKHRIQIKIMKPDSYKYKVRICSTCGAEWRDSSTYNKHIKRCENQKKLQVQSVEVYKCDVCLMEFDKKFRLDSHKRTHTGQSRVKKSNDKTTICTICAANVRMRDINQHMRRHKKQYRFHCEVCQKGFYRKFDYTAHVRIHTGDKPFECGYCTHTYARRDLLLRHYRYRHEEKKFQCDNCGTRYTVKQELRHHIKKCMEREFKERHIAIERDAYLKMQADIEKATDDKKNTDGDMLQPVAEENMIVQVTYTTGDEDSIRTQAEAIARDLPYLETEISN